MHSTKSSGLYRILERLYLRQAISWCSRIVRRTLWMHIPDTLRPPLQPLHSSGHWEALRSHFLLLLWYGIPVLFSSYSLLTCVIVRSPRIRLGQLRPRLRRHRDRSPSALHPLVVRPKAAREEHVCGRLSISKHHLLRRVVILGFISEGVGVMD